MKDGTTSTPQNINWIGGYDGSATIKRDIGSINLTTILMLATGQNRRNCHCRARIYTKGSAEGNGLQMFLPRRKPNGLIDNNIVGADQLLLAGNPYPSALDSTHLYKTI
jgi:hypothetical protein